MPVSAVLRLWGEIEEAVKASGADLAT
jgi:hypothetical protein